MVGDGTWLTTGEAASLLGVHAETVRRWVDDGSVFRPAEVKILPGKHRRVSAAGAQRVAREMTPAGPTAGPTPPGLDPSPDA